MKLSKLVEHIEYELVQGSLDTEVADIAYDSRKIKEGMLFVAIAGTVVDGGCRMRVYGNGSQLTGNQDGPCGRDAF